jgi:hypothetical protein
MWTEAPPGTITEMKIAGPIHANYAAKVAEKESDSRIGFIETLWQQASLPDTAYAIQCLCDDIHLLAASAAKFEHLFLNGARIDRNLMLSFVRGELEHLVTVARSAFDLLQEIIAKLWNNHIRINDPVLEKRRKQNRMVNSFTKTALAGVRLTPKAAADLVNKYGLPLIVAETYALWAPFYSSLVRTRDRIAHGGGSTEGLFVTDKGFCAHPQAKSFRDFPWKQQHHFNENIVSLLPWVANITIGTIQACNDLIASFANSLPLLPPIAPGYMILIRDPANDALGRLLDAYDEKVVFWSDLKL